MLRSASRRLGYLHDSGIVRSTVARWLQADGPLGDLFKMGAVGVQIITSIAPVAPEAILARLSANWRDWRTTRRNGTSGFR